MVSSSVKILCSVVVLIFAAGCKSTTTGPAAPVPVKSKYTYAITTTNLAPLREGEVYSLWAEIDGAMTRLPITLTQGWGDKNNNGSLTLSTLSKATLFVLSVDQSATAAAPEAILASGANSALSATLDQRSLGLDTLRNATGTAIFATFNSDTNEAKKAFYLMVIGPMSLVPGLNSVPTAPAGWTYSLWVTDSTFEPNHLFYYGSFNQRSGKDSRSATDAFDYPGAHGKIDLRIPTASIRVTLEPAARPESARELQPSPYNIVSGELPRTIELNQQLELRNMVAFPTLTVSFR